MTHSLRRRSSFLRLLGSGGIFAALVLVSALSFAGENGTIILTDGEILSGEIVAVHQGDHVQIRLGTGEVRAVAWAQIGTLKVGAGGAIIIGGQPTPQPQPQPTYQPPPPQPTYQPPPPQPTYQPPPPQPVYQPAPAPRRVAMFVPRFELGARIMSVKSGGDIIGQSQSAGIVGGGDLTVDQVIGTGAGIEIDAGFHVLPAWSLYGYFEHDTYSRGSRNNDAAGRTGSGNVLGVGVRWNSAPHHPVGMLVDLAVAARWISFGLPNADQSGYYNATALGGEVRGAIGLSIGTDPHFRLEPALYGTVGGYSSFDDGSCGAYADSYCTSLDESQRGTYWTAGLQLGAHFDL